LAFCASGLVLDLMRQGRDILVRLAPRWVVRRRVAAARASAWAALRACVHL